MMNGVKHATTGDWTSGRMIAEKYILEEEVSGDGVTSLYRVEAAGTGEPRLLCALSAGLTDDPVAAREFKETGELVRKVSHPNLPAVEGIGEAEGRPFWAMESAPGRTLEDLLQAEGRLPSLRVCSLARQIAAALEAAHRVGLLHLGLDPRQIVLSTNAGQEHVTVLGLGRERIRMRRAWTALSPMNGAGGSFTLRDLMPPAPAYCAPEAVLARSQEALDGRADLYSLGVLISQMLTGRLPASAAIPDDDGLEALVWQEEDASAPADSEADVPEPLARLLRQLQERRRELRPSTAKVVTAALDLAAGRMQTQVERSPGGVKEPTPAPADLPLPIPAAELQIAAAPAPSASTDRPAGVDPLLAPAEAAPPPVAGATADAEPVPEAGFTFSELPLTAPTPEPASTVLLRPGGRAVIQTPVPEDSVATPPKTDRQPSALGSSTSVLFKTAPAPKPPAEWGRRALAALAVVLVVAAALFFIRESKKLQWGSLTPTSVDEEHSLSRPDASAAASPAKSNPVNNPTVPPPATSTDGGSGAQGPSEHSTYPNSGSTNAADGGNSSAVPGGAYAPGAQGGPAAKPLSQARPDAGAADIQRALSAGDVFYQTGQYDLAVQAYEGPLKDNPNNALLRSRIERARKAKAAEEEYLGQ
jgi:eukaryotic-like serine/threonine-protein kinase